MAISIVMPALEMAQETGKLISWHKKEGDRITKGEPLLEVETDKAVVEIEAPGEGILAGITAQPGDVVPVGQTIAWLVQPGEVPPTDVAPTKSARQVVNAPVAAAHAAGNSTPSAGAEIKISPKARRLAREQGVDLAKLRGSGTGGEILASDILAASGSPGAPSATAPVTAAPAGMLEKSSSIGRLMAERTTHGWTTVPHFFVVREVDAGALAEVRARRGPEIEKAHGARLTYTDLLTALVARTLVQHPRINASWAGEGVRLNPDVNIGIAVAVNDGVVAAVIPRADRAALGEIAVQRRDLAKRAEAGQLRPADLAGGTFTISNLGMYKVDSFSAIIIPPQAAILAVGNIVDRVVPVQGQPGVRPMMTLTLSCDHRVADGARAAKFMNDLAEAIHQPEKWLR